MKITETQSYINLLISLDDVSRLEDVFDRLFKNELLLFQSPENRYKSLFLNKKIDFSDNLTVSFRANLDDPMITTLKDFSELQSRPCHQISFDFQSSLFEKDISLSINTSSYRPSLSIATISTDRNFVNAAMKSISDIVRNIEPQPKIIRNYIGYFWFIAIPLLMFPTFFLVSEVLNFLNIIFSVLVKIYPTIISHGNTGEPPTWQARGPIEGTVFGLKLLLAFPVAIFVWETIIKLVKFMYPLIEFDFGPAHQRKSLRARKTLAFVCVGIVLQLLIGILASNIVL